MACTQSRQPQNGASCKNDEAKRESASQCICIRKLLPLWFSLCIYLYTTSLSFFISLFFSFFLSVGSSLQLSGTGHPASLRLSFSLALRNLRWIIARARLARSVYTVVYILPGFAQVIYIYIHTCLHIQVPSGHAPTEFATVRARDSMLLAEWSLLTLSWYHHELPLTLKSMAMQS